MRVVVIAAALLLVPLTSAAANPSPEKLPHRPNPTVDVSVSSDGVVVDIPGEPRPDTLVRAAAQGTLARTLANEAFELATPVPGVTGGVTVVNDLDGDGLDDLVRVEAPDLDLVQAADAESVTYTALRGKNGQELWTREVPGQVGAVLPVDTGDAGLVLATIAMRGPAFSTRTDLQLLGVDAAGAQRWTQTLSGVVSGVGTFVLQDAPLVRLPLRLANGHEAVHVDLVDWVYTGGEPYPHPGGADAVIIDSRDGTIVGRPATTGRGRALSSPAGDLNGDGNEDVLFTLAESFSGSEPGDLHAFASTGAQLWTLSNHLAASFDTTVAAAGHSNADGTNDVAVGWGGGGLGGNAEDGVFILNGKDGTVLASRPGSYVSSLGDIDGDGLDEVVARSYCLCFEPQTALYTIEHEAFAGDGRTRYRTVERHELETQEASSFGATTRIYLLLSDHDGDGIRDTRHTGRTTVDTIPTDISGIVSGRSGQRLFADEPIGEDIGAGFTGSGNDLIRVQAAGSNRAWLTAQDGATGQTLWEQQAQLDYPLVIDQFGFADVAATAGDVNGDGVRDVAVTMKVSLNGTTGTTAYRAVVLSGATGASL